MSLFSFAGLMLILRELLISFQENFMAIDFNMFLSVKDKVWWEQVKESMTWMGKRMIDGRLEGIPAFFLHINADSNKNLVTVNLSANVTYTMAGKGQKVIDSQKVGPLECFQDGSLDSLLRTRYGMDNQSRQAHKTSHSMGNPDTGLVKTLYLNEITNIGKGNFYTVRVVTSEMTTGKMVRRGGDISKRYPTMQEASTGYISTMDDLLAAGYKDMSLLNDYVPEGVSFSKNTIFSQEVMDNIKDQMTNRAIDKTVDFIDSFAVDEDIDWDPTGERIKNSTKTAQANPWYSGNIPDPSSLKQYVGTGSVDSSQISSVFNGSSEAISLVNQFDSSLLRNVAFIFNTSGGAFGVYVPALDAKIKDEEAQSMMESKGYKIQKNPDGGFSAYPQSPDIQQDKVKSDMNQVYSGLKMQGGNTFGINMQKVMQAAQQDCRDSNLTDTDDIRMLTVLHLGGTMVHEAVHAKGSTSEGPSEQTEMKFMEWAMNKLNETRKQKWEQKNPGQPYRPLIIDTSHMRSAKVSGWYKKAMHTSATMERTAQYGAQFSAIKLELDPTGRSNWPSFGGGHQTGPTESMLDMARHNDPLDQKMSVEKKMRILQKMKIDNRPDVSMHTEDLLDKDRGEFNGYKSLETMIEDTRSKPLMLPVNASSSQIIKVASLFSGSNSMFGWHNNLDLPMAERMYQDDDYNYNWGGEGSKYKGSAENTSNSVAGQPRYNPEYDDNGFYQKIIDFQQSEPDEWTDLIKDKPNLSTSPWMYAAAGASDHGQVEDSKQEVVEALRNAWTLITTGMIRATRFIASEDLLKPIQEFYHLHDGNVTCKILSSIGVHGKDKIHPIWVFSTNASEKEVLEAEKYASGKDKSEKAKKIFDLLCGDPAMRKAAIGRMLDLAAMTCHKYGVDDLYLVGGYPRSILTGEDSSEVRDLDFSAAWPEQAIKVGGLMAEAIGVKDVGWYHRTMTMTWEWLGVKCDFRGDYVPVDIRDMMRLKGVKTTPINMDIYNRDFTMNMLIYSLKDNKVYDVCGSSKKDIEEKVIRTFFDPSVIVRRNPLVILRAIKFAVRYGFRIDEALGRAIKESSHLLFGSLVSPDRLLAGVEDIISEGKEEAEKIIREFGMIRLLEMIEEKEKEE
jgi:hypothetical protein